MPRPDEDDQSPLDQIGEIKALREKHRLLEARVAELEALVVRITTEPPAPAP